MPTLYVTEAQREKIREIKKQEDLTEINQVIDYLIDIRKREKIRNTTFRGFKE